jgi:hypothetical protein
MNINTYDVATEVYDTLMKNTQYTQFETDKVTAQELDAKQGRISFEYCGSRVYIEITTEPLTLE